MYVNLYLCIYLLTGGSCNYSVWKKAGVMYDRLQTASKNSRCRNGNTKQVPY